MKPSFMHGVYVLVTAGAAVLGLGLVRGDNSLTQYFALGKSRTVLAATVKQLEQENANLSEEILRLKKSPDYARKVLRDKYHLTDADEDIVFFAE